MGNAPGNASQTSPASRQGRRNWSLNSRTQKRWLQTFVARGLRYWSSWRWRFQTRESAFSLTNRFLARNPAGLSNSSAARSAAKGEANHGRCNLRSSAKVQAGRARLYCRASSSAGGKIGVLNLSQFATQRGEQRRCFRQSGGARCGVELVQKVCQTTIECLARQRQARDFRQRLGSHTFPSSNSPSLRMASRVNVEPADCSFALMSVSREITPNRADYPPSPSLPGPSPT